MSVGASSRRKLTHADYLLFPDDGKRRELLDGEDFILPSPRVRHQEILQRLYMLLIEQVRARDLGKVFTAPLDVILSDYDVVEPDLLFVAKGNEAILQDWVRGAPDLVVEILSPPTRERDLGIKSEIYEKRGVKEYWIVDPEAEAIEVRRFGKQKAGPLVLDRGDTLTSPLLPGLELAPGQIFG